MKVMAFALTAVLALCSVCSGAPRVLEVSPESLEFVGYAGGGDPAAQVVLIWNSGSAPMDWQVTEDCGWLTVEPNSGTSSGEVDDVNVIVDISGLEEGVYNCLLTVDAGTAANSPKIVDVNLAVYEPLIEISKGQFEFFGCEAAPSPNSQALIIRNTGSGSLEWSIDYDCGWLTVEPNTGSCSGGEVNEVVLSVDTAGMTVGDYYLCELSVSAEHAQNSPEALWVLLSFGAGDVDRDCDVDMRDFGIMGLAWLSGPGDGHWNPNCDISAPKDDVIDELDLDVLGESWLLSAAGGGGGSGRTITIRPQGGGGPYAPGEIVTIELYATGYCGLLGSWLSSLDIAAITASGVWGSTNPSAVDVGILASCLTELLGWHVGDIGSGTNLITDIRGRAYIGGGCNICGFVLYEFDLDVGDEGGGFVIDLSGVTTLNPFGIPLSVDVVPLSVTVVDANSSDEVVISCTATEGLPGEVTVSYTCTEPNYVRGFALDITVDSGAVIDSVYDVNGQYWVYPGSIDINEAGEIVDYGSVVCDPCVYPGTLGGLDTNGITVEMGALFEPVSGSPPGSSGTLLKFTVDRNCNVGIGLNAARGGVVMKEPASVPTVTLNGCIVAECCPPDQDNDMDIDLYDYYAMQGALAYADYLLSGGAGTSYYIAPGHVIVGHLWNECMDADNDDDIDLTDYYTTQGLLAYAEYLCDAYWPWPPEGIECDPLRVLPEGPFWLCPIGE